MVATFSVVALAALVTFSVFGSRGEPADAASLSQDRPVKIPEGAQSMVLGGGCFWCIEPLFEMLKGVHHVEVGYAGGDSANVSYSQVMSGTSGHAEVVKIWFDPEAISADDMLRIFFTIHDPTTLNRQGPDRGTQYRSAVFFANDEQKSRAERIVKEIADEEIWDDPIVTKIEPLVNYVTAEVYHQDYYRKFETATPAERAMMNGRYCTAFISPKVAKFRKKFEHLLKR